MQYKYILTIVILVIFFTVLETDNASADTLYSDWVGTLDKSYELAWQQKETGVYNGYRTYFFLEYTYIMNNSKKYPTYCIEYYKKGPRGNSDYGKAKLKNTDMNSSVRNGLIEIIKNGYPNVKNPYGTQDISEAYYATSAAIHVWTMYHGVDAIAGKYLGWFTFKDGFSIKKNDLKNYTNDFSTASTASGWHAIGPNNNESSRRTWSAAMKLLLDAIDADVQQPYINIKLNKDAYLDKNNIVYEYLISSNLCSDLKIKLNNSILGCEIKYSTEKNNSVIAKIYIPVNSVKSGEKYSLYGYGTIKGADDIENYYYTYHTTGQYQSMVYLEDDKTREIKTGQINFKIPILEYYTYYDLNYSGNNYIKDGDFLDLSNVSYKGDTVISSKGNVSFKSYDVLQEDYNKLNVNFYSTGPENCLRISTLLNSSVNEGFKSVSKELLILSCRLKSNVETSVRLCFENSSTVYEKKITEVDQWQEFSIGITKSDYESNILCIYTDKSASIDILSMQLESGTTFTEYKVENSAKSDPLYTVHKYGNKYGNLYRGNVPVRENYVFVGWNTKKDGSGIFVNDGDIVTKGHQVLYAIWTTQDTYNVYFHYNSNGGEYLVKNNQYIENQYGYDVIEVPNKTEFDIQVSAYRKDYDFIGWSLENNLGSDVEDYLMNEVYVDGQDVHLYANYRREHKIRFHYFDEKSGTEQVLLTAERYSYNNKQYVGTIMMPSYGASDDAFSIPAISGYIFKGWTVSEKENKNVDYLAGDTEDVKMYDDYYAIYEKLITVKFYDNVYGTEDETYHTGSSYLHLDYKLPVYMNYKGIVTEAEFTLPNEVCEINGYDFYGWSDSRMFNGNVCYYADEKGTVVTTETDLRFYSLYVKRRKVTYFDYDFNKGVPHIEKEIYAYEYMNYNGSVYNPELIIQAPCPVDDLWEFNYWSENSLIDSDNKYYPEDRYLVKDDVSFFATYNKDIEVICHSLVNDDSGNVVEKKDVLNNIVTMDCSGNLNSNSLTLPEIEAFEDENGWGGIGYSIENDDSSIVTHEQNKDYSFYTDADLYAIYITDINISYFDYSINQDIPLSKTEYHEIYKTCNNDLKGVNIVLSDLLTDDIHDNSWWTASDENSNDNKLYPGQELIIYNNSVFYAWHSDKNTLTCNDFQNNNIRKREYITTSITNYTGSIIPGKVLIPSQGKDNDIIATEYWSTSSDIVAEYWSNDYISLYNDVVINAIYQKPVNIIYNTNGGYFDNNETEIIDTEYAYYNVTGTKKIPVFIPEYQPQKEGYVFLDKWNTEPDGFGVEYINGAAYSTEYDLYLYAMWENAGEPKLSVIDRYFFVGEEITYSDIVGKIIAIDKKGNSAVEKIKIVKINNRPTDGLSNLEIENKIVADYPRQYNIEVMFSSEEQILNESFVIYIVDKYNKIDRLRYISDDFLYTIDTDSKWNYGLCFGKLIMSLNKKRTDAEYVYTITKEGVE